MVHVNWYAGREYLLSFFRQQHHMLQQAKQRLHQQQPKSAFNSLQSTEASPVQQAKQPQGHPTGLQDKSRRHSAIECPKTTTGRTDTMGSTDMAQKHQQKPANQQPETCGTSNTSETVGALTEARLSKVARLSEGRPPEKKRLASETRIADNRHAKDRLTEDARLSEETGLADIARPPSTSTEARHQQQRTRDTWSKGTSCHSQSRRLHRSRAAQQRTPPHSHQAWQTPWQNTHKPAANSIRQSIRRRQQQARHILRKPPRLWNTIRIRRTAAHIWHGPPWKHTTTEPQPSNMAEAVVSPAKKAPKKPAVKPAHPSYAITIKETIKALKERGGSSSQAMAEAAAAASKKPAVKSAHPPYQIMIADAIKAKKIRKPETKRPTEKKPKKKPA